MYAFPKDSFLGAREVTTSAEQEAKRRWPTAAPWTPTPAQGQNAMHFAFVSGAEWAESRYRELLEAAREYRDELNEVGIVTREDDVVTRLLAAAAALEERIRERDYTVNLLESEARQFRAIISRERAENERLREAIIWMSGSSEFGPGQPAHEHWVEIRDTLLFPPPSTEGTE